MERGWSAMRGFFTVEEDIDDDFYDDDEDDEKEWCD